MAGASRVRLGHPALLQPPSLCLTPAPGTSSEFATSSLPLQLITHLADNERVLGVHYLGPHAGEIIQVGVKSEVWHVWCGDGMGGTTPPQGVGRALREGSACRHPRGGRLLPFALLCLLYDLGLPALAEPF